MSSGNNLNRRKFLNIAGLATASGFLVPKDLPGTKHITETPARSLPFDNPIAEVLETKVICREPGRFPDASTQYVLNTNGHLVLNKEPKIEPDRYLGWPTIVKTGDNELIIAFSGDRDSHVCPWGKTQLIRSRDNGITWSEPETITSTPLDDRDAGIIQTQKGTLVVSWFTSLAYENPAYKASYQKYFRVGEKIPKETKEKWLGNWIRRSEDGGKSWQEPIRTVATAPHGPIQLRDGRLLYIGNGRVNGQSSLVAEQSEDDGRSWKVIATFDRPEGSTAGIAEPHVVELKNGKIIAMFRNEPKNRECFLLQSESIDGGKTWTRLHTTGIWGYPPHLIELKNGWMLVVYGYRREPFGERACISRDEGKTWDMENEVILCQAPSHDLGYPASAQLDDGSILTIYYQAEKFGEPTSLMSTHWKLKQVDLKRKKKKE